MKRLASLFKYEKNTPEVASMIELAEIPIEKLVRTRRRTLSIEITSTGKIIIRAPLKASLKLIQKFVEDRKDWIEKTKRRLQKNHQPPFLHQFIENENFYFLGNPYPLIFNPLIKKITFHENAFYVQEKVPLQIRTEFTKWYKNKAKNYFELILDQEAKKMGLAYKRLKLSSAQKRWGSCSQEGNISLCWRLIMAPESVSRYVAIHELAHLKEMNHSKEFWQLVEKFHPNYKEDKKWLHEQGHLLNWD